MMFQNGLIFKYNVSFSLLYTRITHFPDELFVIIIAGRTDGQSSLLRSLGAQNIKILCLILGPPKNTCVPFSNY